MKAIKPIKGSKRIKGILVLMMAALVFTACTNTVAETSEAESISIEDVVRLEPKAVSPGQGSGNPAPGAEDQAKAVRPEGTRMMVIVHSAHGNAIKAETVELPEGLAERMNQAGDRQARPDGVEAGQGSATTNPLMVAGGGQIAGQGGGMKVFGGNRSAEGSSMSFEGTGEVIDLLIPVGTEIVNMQDRENPLQLDQLQKGMVMQVVIDDLMTEENKGDDETFTYYVEKATVLQ